MDVLGNLKKVLSFVFRAGAYTITFKGDTVTPPTKDITINIPDGNASQTLVTDGSTNTLTNKSIDADTNTITNIDNDEIRAGAAIDATKIHDGSVDNTEFGYLDGVTSSIQTQLTDNATNLSDHLADAVDAHDASAISYDNASSGLAATEVQAAIDEVEGRVDTNETNIATNTSNNTGTVTVHSDVTDAGSGAIITGTERTDIGLNNTHRGTVTGNPHAVTKSEVGLGNVANVDTTDATNITSGTLADARLSSNVDLLDADQTLTGEKTHEKIVLASGTAVDANASSTLAEPDKTVIALTGVPTVTDIVTITATSTTTGKYIQLQNDTASTFVVRETGNVNTGGSGDLDLLPEAVIILRYDGTDWRIIGGSGGAGGGLATELYTHATLPATLVKDIRYLVDISGGDAAALMPILDSDNNGSTIEVWPINAGATGNTITLTRSSTDNFNDPDLGVSDVYIIDIGSSSFVFNNTDSVFEIEDSYWNSGQTLGVGDMTVDGDLIVTGDVNAGTYTGLPIAAGATEGIVSNTTQTFNGAKSFGSEVTSSNGFTTGTSGAGFYSQEIDVLINNGATATLATLGDVTGAFLVIIWVKDNVAGTIPGGTAMVTKNGANQDVRLATLESNSGSFSMASSNQQVRWTNSAGSNYNFRYTITRLSN